MDRLRRSFRDSFRRRKDRSQQPESSRPHVWQADESAVRAGTCTFHVKYLGCVEVFESRGMQVCEEALKVLRASRRRPIRALLHISGDGLRVVEDETKGLIVDQTIEKVSFCAPDRNHERGFSYICRDGTTRRWMAHGFLALRDTGERLSHAVGCAFSACLERKQRRDKECAVTMTFDQTTNSFTRQGSFRTTTMTEANADREKKANAKPVNPFAIERPHATPHMLERQGSFRGLGQLGNSSPFKRQMSLRVSDLPSNAERIKSFIQTKPPVSPIPEQDSVTQLCVQLTQGLSQLTNSDDFNFNSQTSVNQNFNAEIRTETALFTQKLDALSESLTLMSPPDQNTTGINFNQALNQSTPNKNAETKSTNDSIEIVEARGLPKPDQWLNQIERKSPSIRSTEAPVPSPPRRAPLLAPHSRTMSLGTAESFGKLPNQNDPFDAEWAATATDGKSTNPFLTGSPQPFQVRL